MSVEGRNIAGEELEAKVLVRVREQSEIGEVEHCLDDGSGFSFVAYNFTPCEFSRGVVVSMVECAGVYTGLICTILRQVNCVYCSKIGIVKLYNCR